ncbi:hypothetical protein ONZ45_g8041 [Pleurotus djamor]|nr:hypothetical protein ONZ45_g8041 [Pleurotus djamor]
MFDRLPLELLQHIVDHVDDDSDLGNFYAAGDMTIRSVIAPILFRTLDISLWMMDIELFGGSARDTRVAVTNYGGFGCPCVESLLITAESSTGVDEEFQRYVNEVLPFLVNLKTFSFMHYGSHEGAPFFSHVADRLSKQPYPFSLTHFIWEDVISDPDAFAAFLAAQPNLVYLGVITDSPQLKIPYDALKNLHYLKGDRDLAFNIFPGRNVEHAWIDLLCSPEVPITPALDQAFRKMKTLSCPAYYPENVFEVVRHFSELEYLRISDSSVHHVLFFPVHSTYSLDDR